MSPNNRQKSPKRVAMSRRLLASRIASLSAAQQKEILDIVVRHGIPYSSNQNGFFFDMDDVTPTCHSQIQEFVEYSLSNKDTLDAYDRQLQLCKISRGSMVGSRASKAVRKYASRSPFDESALIDDIVQPGDNDPALQNLVNQLYVCRNADARAPACVNAGAKFVNSKKRFSKPPRHKAFDPDDTSMLATDVASATDAEMPV